MVATPTAMGRKKGFSHRKSLVQWDYENGKPNITLSALLVSQSAFGTPKLGEWCLVEDYVSGSEPNGIPTLSM